MGSPERPYPTDYVGAPIPPEELGFEIGHRGEWNNHHLAYFRRSFGRLAISQTFRDLELMQREMPVVAHRRLHTEYTGIQVPSLLTMMDIIDGERQSGGQLKIYDDTRERGDRYVRSDITLAKWNFLKKEYNHHSD